MFNLRTYTYRENFEKQIIVSFVFVGTLFLFLKVEPSDQNLTNKISHENFLLILRFVH